VVENPPTDTPNEPLNLADIRNSLQSLMWRNVGLHRDAEGLAEALENLNHWCRYVLPRQFADPTGWELQNMLCAARLMTLAAQTRQETRGAHVRTDFPKTDDALWNQHSAFKREEASG
jgi:L-aspartate oxidase